MMTMTFGIWRAALFFTAAHVAHEVALATKGVHLGYPPWYFLVGATATAVLGFLDRLWARRATVDVTRFVRMVAYPMLQIGCGVLAAVSGVFVCYAFAYTAATVILVWIYAAAPFGLVQYDPTSPFFLLSRSTLYAGLRASTQLLVRNTPFPPRIGRLVPFGIATSETVGMHLVRSESYAFATGSTDFAVYAVLKSAVFLTLPVLEDFLVETARNTE